MSCKFHSLTTEGVGDGAGPMVGVAVGVGVRGNGVTVGVGVIGGDAVPVGFGVGPAPPHASPNTNATVNPMDDSNQPFLMALFLFSDVTLRRQ